MRLKAAPLIYENGWQIDPAGIRRAITSHTRAIVVVHPNNPTGHFTKPWEAAELARLCREFDLSLIVDEVFLDYGFGAKGASFASGVEGVPVHVVSGLSKIAGLPQMKAAWIVVTGPEREQALARLEVIADTFLSMNAPVQWALPAWLAGRAAIQDQIRSRVAANLAVLDRATGARSRLCSGWRSKADGTRCCEFRRSSRTSRRFWRCWSAASGCIRATFSGCRSRVGWS